MENQPQILNSGIILKTSTHVLYVPVNNFSVISGLPGLNQYYICINPFVHGISGDIMRMDPPKILSSSWT